LRSQMNNLDIDVLLKYVAQYPVQSVRRRIGYFLDQLDISKNLLNKIDVGEKGYSPLYYSRSNKGKINKRWRLIING